MSYKVDDVINFIGIKERKREEIAIEFNLSNTQSYNLLKWMVSGGWIDCVSVRTEGKLGKPAKYYFVRKNEN